jgi:hypothetical protein
LTRARFAAATIREMRRNKYSEAMLVDRMVDLKRPPM